MTLTGRAWRRKNGSRTLTLTLRLSDPGPAVLAGLQKASDPEKTSFLSKFGSPFDPSLDFVDLNCFQNAGRTYP